jgi:neurofibromin 1
MLIDVSRQCLFAFHSGDLDSLDQAADAYRETVLAILRFESPDVNPLSLWLAGADSYQVLAEVPNGGPAVLIATVAMMSILIQPDVEQVNHTPAALAALAKLTAIANRSVLIGWQNEEIEVSHQRDALTSQMRMLEDLADLPNATGEAHHLDSMLKRL